MLNSSKTRKRSPWAIVAWALILVVVAGIRIRLLDFPLERDEGEFAYAGQLLLDGITPYQGAYNVALKLPGTCLAYAGIFTLFGQTAMAIHAALLLVVLATAGLLFLITRRISGEWPAVVAAGTYALLSTSPPTNGLSAHATHFVMLPALAGIWLLQYPSSHTSRTRLLCAGLLLGVAILMKQTGAAFAPFALLWVARCGWHETARFWRKIGLRLGLLIAGMALPLGLTCLIIAARGEFGQFWFWGFEYARAHAAIATLGQSILALLAMAARLFWDAPGLWVLSLAGLILAFGKKALPGWRFFTLTFALFSFIAIWPGWRGHYFIQLLPAASLLAGIAAGTSFDWLDRRQIRLLPRTAPYLFFAVAAAGFFIGEGKLLFRLPPDKVSHEIYGINPFPETREIARWLKQHCPPTARVAVIGSEPQIYFYSQRRAATGYICTYPLVELHSEASRMQSEMIQEIESAPPGFVVFVWIPASWLAQPGCDEHILDWFNQYRKDHLQMICLVDFPPDRNPEFRWLQPEETDAQPRTTAWLALYRNTRVTTNVPPRN